MAGIALGQQTPQQLANNAQVYGDLSARQIALAQTYLLATIAGMGSVSASSLAASAAPLAVLSDKQVSLVQVYLLNQFAGTVGASVQTTNNGVLATNGFNIYISPTPAFNTITSKYGTAGDAFTNAYGAIAIGWNFPFGGVTGNGIWIGGGGAGFASGVGTNSIGIGDGIGAIGINSDGSYPSTSPGAIAIGNQVDSLGPGSIVIGASQSSFISAGGWNSVVLGNATTDGGTAFTNVFFLGHYGGNVQWANNTFFFGNGSGGGTNAGRTRNFVFINGGAYMDDGALIGNAWGLTNGTFHYGTNAIAEGGATLTLDARKFQTVLATNASFAFGGIANLTGPGNVDGGDVWVTNITGGVLTATFGGGWAQDKPNGLNAPNSTWGITNGAGYSHMTWRAMSGSFSNYILYGKQ